MGRAFSCKGWWAVPLLWLLMLQPACTKSPDDTPAQEQPVPKGPKWVLAKGRQPAAVAVVVHGLGAPKSMDQVVWQLTEGWQAADVLQVTLAGHEGGPEGPPDEQGKIWLKQLQEACQQAKQRAGNRLELWFLAHSLGVAPWADMLRQENTQEPTVRFHRAVWFAPAVSLTHLLESLAHIVDLVWLRNNRDDIEKIDRFLGYIFPKRKNDKTIDYKKIFDGDFNEKHMRELGDILNSQKSLKDEKQSILQWGSIKSVFPAELQAELEPIFTLKPDSKKYQRLGQTTRVGLQVMGAISNAIATSQKDARLNRFATLVVTDPDDLVVSKAGMAQQKQANEFTNWRLVNAPATGHGKVTHVRDQPAIRKMVKEFLGIPKKVPDGQPGKDSSGSKQNDKQAAAAKPMRCRSVDSCFRGFPKRRDAIHRVSTKRKHPKMDSRFRGLPKRCPGWRMAKASFCHPDERSEEGSPQNLDRCGDPSRRCRDTQDDRRGSALAKSNVADFLEGPFRGLPKRYRGRQTAQSSLCHPDERSEEGSPQTPDRWVCHPRPCSEPGAGSGEGSKKTYTFLSFLRKQESTKRQKSMIRDNRGTQ